MAVASSLLRPPGYSKELVLGDLAGKDATNAPQIVQYMQSPETATAMPQSATPTDQFCEEDRAARRRRLNKQAQKACRARRRERRRLEEDGQSSAPQGDASSPHILTERGDSAAESSPSSQSGSRLGCADDIMAMLAAGALPDFFSADPTLDHPDPMGLIQDDWCCDAVSQDTQQHLPPPFPGSLVPDVASEQKDDRTGEVSSTSLPDLGRVDGGANRCFDAVDLADCDIRMELEARVRDLNAKVWDLAVLLGRWGNGHMVS